MKPEELKLHKDRHEALEAEVARHRDRHSSGFYEMMWERTLGELSGGEFDAVLGLRVFVARLLARNDRQQFLDQVATRLCVIARNGSTAKSELEQYARVAYDQAEALWRERQKRRNSHGDEEIPF
ncbi:MAG TPA: hypothetical protein VL494_13415 [Steroidobacteraceae bacterium]|jgi:hypothetical protein|nr:hypothetical protein [Steroidobacteraceae bacterium]